MMTAPERIVPTVSVCIPTYRGAAHLRATIESVLAQTFRDFELLVIDDNSPDDTFAIASGYDDPRMRCLRNARNLGPEGNWNRCLTEASSRYVKLLPQDDLLAPECLQQQVAVLEADERREIALVFCARAVVDAQGRQMLVRRSFGRTPQRLSGEALFQRCLRRGTNVIGEPGGVLFRRDLVKTVGPFDASFPYVVDLDYWLRLLSHGDGYYLPETLASFRVSPGQWSVAIGANQSAEFRGLAAKMVKNGRVRAGALDLAVGRALSFTNNILRLFVYRWLFAKG
jgi:glycosyltransferase involved in cell wall biosynthesis